MKKIAMFNHKGGVSKTTTTFNLGWKLASKGCRVMIVDADPQCNLSGMVLGYTGSNGDDFYSRYPNRNIKSALTPAFESQPKLIEPVDCYPVSGVDGLFLLPGHINFSENDVTLAIAQELSGSIQTLQNLPGAISHLIDITASELDVDYVLIDLNPSLSSINQNIIMISDYFLVPTSADYFSVMAIESLANVLPRWSAWAQRAVGTVLSRSSYPFPSVQPKFIGTIVQNYKIRKRIDYEEDSLSTRSGVASVAFQDWMDKVDVAVEMHLAPALANCNMILPLERFKSLGLSNYSLASISNFNSLIAKSQKYQVPIFALSDEQLELNGEPLKRTQDSRDMFDNLFNNLVDHIVALTSDEV